ncbi:MAG: class I SAM-dependent methyltransferase [Candidatus Woesearchaeota archaeon]|jgi:ubiquinone/menaquinone biosynthesis C-methylase UbiE|nr:class I SAM-dependent methyltransferase [Candidatus Woesearchaeota archaeon]MDP7457555.1 class I SAM-dependent methyltransferase [Candidatus Woesearchaeota archaeon]
MEEENYDVIYSLEKQNWWYRARRDLLYKVLKGMHKQFDKTLDFGCGVGANLSMLRKISKNVIGIDYSQKAIDYCANRGYDHAVRMSGDNLEFEENSFDLVLCSDVLEHIEDDKTALKEIARVLKPGGILLFTVPAHNYLWGPVDEISNHFRRYELKKIRPLLPFNLSIRRLGYWNLSTFFPNLLFVRISGLFNGKKRSSNTLDAVPGFLNSLLYKIICLENKAFTHSVSIQGVSIVGICQKIL